MQLLANSDVIAKCNEIKGPEGINKPFTLKLFYIAFKYKKKNIEDVMKRQLRFIMSSSA